MKINRTVISVIVCAVLFVGISLYVYFNNPNENTPPVIDNETDDVIIETEDVEIEEVITETEEIVADTETIVDNTETDVVPEETTPPPVDTTTTSETTTQETIPSPEPEIIPEPELPSSGYAISVTQSDIDMMAKLVYLEARGEPYNGQVAVAEVVINRVLSRSFPNTVYGVIYQSGQFTPAYSIPYTSATQTQYSAVYDALNGNGVLNNRRVVYFAMGRSCGSYYTTIGNHVFGCE